MPANSDVPLLDGVYKFLVHFRRCIGQAHDAIRKLILEGGYFIS